MGHAARQLRSRLDVDERRTQLLRLGLELFGERSYDTISIDDISRAGSISRSLLYHYFRNKRGFFVETVRFAARQLRERINPDPEAPPRERLRHGLSAYLDYVSRFAGAYSTLLRNGFDPEVSEILEQTREAIIADITGDLEPADKTELVKVALRGWLGMVEFSCLEWLERRRVNKDELLDVLEVALEAAMARALGVPVDEVLGPRELSEGPV